MEFLFSYGTLQQAHVQLETFGRLLNGKKDALVGWSITTIQITDKKVIETSGTDIHPVLKATGASEDIVQGMALEISHAELLLADKYEVKDYRRIQIALQSGQQAWVYVSANHATSP
jgi:gamma-glutamylcyclotransferase (GGCT)/AIG2-like uncharacterized protein YtfP